MFNCCRQIHKMYYGRKINRQMNNEKHSLRLVKLFRIIYIMLKDRPPKNVAKYCYSKENYILRYFGRWYRYTLNNILHYINNELITHWVVFALPSPYDALPIWTLFIHPFNVGFIWSIKEQVPSINIMQSKLPDFVCIVSHCLCVQYVMMSSSNKTIYT